MKTGRLLRVLGLTFGLAVIVGNTIGAGILRTPGSIAAGLPNEWLFVGVWVLGGLYALLGCAQLAELGTAIPRAGGQYAFAQRALGPYAGFVVGWSDWLSTCGTTTAVSIVIGEYSGLLFPAVAAYENHKVAIAIAVAVAFALLQWRGVKWGGRTQEVTTLLKALAFVGLIAACFAFGGNAEPPPPAEGWVPPVMPTGLALAGAIMVALQSVIYAYDGWAGVVYFSEEVRDPGRDVPRSLFGGTLAVIAIYVLVNLALLYVLPIERMAGEPFAGELAATTLFGPAGGQIILGIVILSMLSGINAYHLMASRTLFAMSRDRLFFRGAERVNEGGTPAVALLLSTIVAVAFSLWGNFERVTAALAFFFVTNYTLSFISVFVLRRREPNLPRPYRAWGYPWTTALALAGSVAFLVGAVAADLQTDHEGKLPSSFAALGLLAMSYPVYAIIRSVSRPSRPRRSRQRRKKNRK